MTSQKTWIFIIVSVLPPSWKQVASHFQSWIIRFTWWKQCNIMQKCWPFFVRFIFVTWYILWTFLYRFWKWITLFIKDKRESMKKFSVVYGELVIMPDFSVNKRSTRRGSEWEILEGLKDGQRFDKKPDVYSGYLHKKRKWPLKGWHKVS